MLVEQTRIGRRIHARNRNVATDPVDDDRHRQEKQTLAQLRRAERIAEGAKRLLLPGCCHTSESCYLSCLAAGSAAASTLPPAFSIAAFAPAVGTTPTPIVTALSSS